MKAERVGRRTYLAHNGRGAKILVGPNDVEGAFTPGELLKIALAVCAGMSSDHRLAHVLGQEFHSTLEFDATVPEGENRYEHLDVSIHTDTSELDDDALAELRERADYLIAKGCTVGRTLRAGAQYTVTVDPSR